MPNRVLIDNWTLQNAGELLCNGLTGDTADDLLLSPNGESFRYEETSADVIRFETLCQLLNTIVLADELYVDNQFTASWAEFTPLNALRDDCILIAKPLRQAMDSWVERREAMAEELCGRGALRKVHAENKRSFAATGQSVDDLAGQLIWGGAGMLARAEFLGVPYVPHPARQRLFSQARFLCGPSSAEKQLTDFVHAERLRVSRAADETGLLASVHVPPVALEAIERSTTIADVVKTAIGLRSDFEELRRWLSGFQQALDREDLPEILKCQRMLQSVARHVSSRLSSAIVGDTTVQLGFSWLKIATKIGSPANWTRNRFGIRAQLNRLIVGRAGRKSVKTFLKLLGEENSQNGQVIEREFLRRASALNADARP